MTNPSGDPPGDAPDLQHMLNDILSSGQPAHQEQARQLIEAIQALWDAHLHDPYLTRNDGDT
jgi:hypothetical protein